MPKIAPCLNCAERTIEPNCHATCEKYLASKVEAERVRENRKNMRQVGDYEGAFADRIHQHRIKKKKGRI